MEKQMQFKKEILFDRKHKLCKLRTISNGNFMGNFNDNFSILIEKQKKWVNGGFSDTEFEYVAYLAPIKHTKIDG
jgi:hypothetical protein